MVGAISPTLVSTSSSIGAANSVICVQVYVHQCFVSVCVHHLCDRCLKRPEEGIRSPGTELQTDARHHVGSGYRTHVFYKNKRYP